MEKLIVKNFGPIKEAEIDLTKYVVFIGDTSTGKSVLAKLIAIFRDNDLVNQDMMGGLDEFKNLLSHYNIDFSFDNSRIEYENGEFKIILSKGTISFFRNNQLYLLGGSSFKTKDLSLLIDDINNIEFVEENAASKFMEKLRLFLSAQKHTNLFLPIYIPAERVLTSMVGSSISGLWANNVALPGCFKDFAANYELARKNISAETYETLDFDFRFENDIDYIRYNNQEVKLSKASSGLQSLIPLILVLDNELNRPSVFRISKNILIEEPELNLFPTKQKKIIEYILSIFNFKATDKLTITTHSPYILSVLDTLILAKNTFNEHPELKEEINAIVSEDKWIDYDDISVYEVRNDGTIKSIKNPEFKSIDTNAIDGVSDIISEQFDKLTELRYAQ